MTDQSQALRASKGVAPEAVRAGDLLCISVRSGTGGTLREQAEGAIDGVLSAVAAAGGDAGDLVDVISLHGDVGDIDETFDVARRRLDPPGPAWTPVACASFPEPGTRVAIKAIADLGESKRRSFVPDSIKWWKRFPVAAGCEKGGRLWIAGQYGTDADGYVNTPGDHAGQARNALNRVGEICRIVGGALDDLIAMTSFHHDPRGIEPSVSLYADEFFSTAQKGFAWTPAGASAIYGFGMLCQFRGLADLTSGAVTATPGPRTPLTGAARKEGGMLVGAIGAPDVAGADNRGDPIKQAECAVGALSRQLESLGSSLTDLVDLICMYKDPRCSSAVWSALSRSLTPDEGPAWTEIGTTGLSDPDHLLALHGLALIREPAEREGA